MARKRLSREKIINAFLASAFDKGAGATSLQDISDILLTKKASLYNHFSSRDDIYAAVLAYCRNSLAELHFLPDTLLADGAFLDEDIFSVCKKVLRRYLLLFGIEPLFQIYIFIRTEQYFCAEAYQTADAELTKVQDGIRTMLEAYAESGKIPFSDHSQLKQLADWFGAAFMQQLDAYIMRKKETVRQNPVCGAGSLFSMPPDDSALNSILLTAEANLKMSLQSAAGGCVRPTEL